MEVQETLVKLAYQLAAWLNTLPPECLAVLSAMAVFGLTRPRGKKK